MSITLETVLGNAVADQDKILYVQVERTRRPRVTANFARNIGSGYVVVEAPENIEGLLIDNFAKDEQELVFVYDMEEEERVMGHNERERQKIEEWEEKRDRLNVESKERYSRLIAGWQERESRRIPEWQERERIRREEYDLELAIRQEEAERADLGYAGLVFDALERRERNVSAIRTQYKDQGFLSDMRKKWLDTYLTNEGIEDEVTRKEIIGLTNSKDSVLTDRLREILIKKLKVEFPDANEKEPLPPYEPEPVPEPEPKPKLERPDLGPRPKLESKEVTSLLPELESVVIAAYKGDNLESLNLTQQAWSDAGVLPQEIYDRIRGNVRFLNSQYMLVRVVGNGDGNVGSLTLIELDTNKNRGLNQRVPKSLRGYFQRPTDIVEDAFMLSVVLQGIVRDYLLSNDDEAASIIISEKRPYLHRTIYEKVIGRESPITINLFPVVSDASYSEEDGRKYKDIAERVDAALKKDLLGGEDSVAYKAAEMGVPVTELVDTIRHLIDSVPAELFRLRYLSDVISSAKREISDFERGESKGRVLTAFGRARYEHLQTVHYDASKERDGLTSQLGSLVDGSASRGSRLNLIETIKLFNAYGLGKGTNYVATEPAK